MNQIVFIPLGSYEQHGTLLPHDTDSFICENICMRVAAQFGDSVILPTIPFGLSQEHSGIGKTITLSINTYLLFLQDIIIGVASSFSNCKLIVLINGHGGNQDLASVVCSQKNYSGYYPKAMVVHVFPESTRKLAIEKLGGFDAHADSVEASVYASLKEVEKCERISLEKLDEVIVPKHKFRFFPARDITKSGIITSANYIVVDPYVGELLVEDSVNSISNEIREAIELIRE